jgi:hypothetical protein
VVEKEMNFFKWLQTAWKKFEDLCIAFAQRDQNIPTEDLMWLETDLRPGNAIDWTHADTIDFKVGEANTVRRIVLETEVVATEEKVEELCQNLLESNGRSA